MSSPTHSSPLVASASCVSLFLALAASGTVPTDAKMVLPDSPPRGWNSFDLQWDRRYEPSVPKWNESLFNSSAKALAAQLLPYGYDTIVIDGGWSDHVDKYGRPIPNETMWPSAAGGAGFKPLADLAHSLGLKFGVWTLRGVSPTAVAKKTPILNSTKTIDEITFDQTTCPQTKETRWCKCTWDPQGVGINTSHHEAQLFYDSVVELYTSWGVDFIKWDCMYDNFAGYSKEVVLAANAVKKVDANVTLSLSPGGGMTVDSAAWVAGFPDGRGPTVDTPGDAEQLNNTHDHDHHNNDNDHDDDHHHDEIASMYRITGDFHGRPTNYGEALDEHAFIVGNMSARGVIGANHTWPDSDIVDLGRFSAFVGRPQQYLHASMWMMAQSPLMFGGPLPITDNATLDIVTSDLGLLVQAKSSNLTVSYSGDCRCKPRKNSADACQLYNDPSSPDHSCVALWVANLGPSCRAVAVLNIGNTSSFTQAVNYADMGLPPIVSYGANLAFPSLDPPVLSMTGFKVTVEPNQGTLLVVNDARSKPQGCA